MKPGNLVSITVARGRSVSVPVVTGERVIDGIQQLTYAERLVGPGETVEVSVEDAQFLVAGGYAVNPNAVPEPVRMVVQDGTRPYEMQSYGWDRPAAQGA